MFSIRSPAGLQRLSGCVSLRAIGLLELGAREELMHWRRAVAALSIALALAGCAQAGAGQTGAQYSPYPPDNNGNMPEHGVGGGSGM
jgi:hypothetical protein